LTTFTDHRHNTRAWCHANLLANRFAPGSLTSH